jgi:hypothetical protein
VASPVWLGLFISIQILRPWLLIRVSPLISERLGHFAGNTELYLCEKESEINIPKRKYIDLFYFGGTTKKRTILLYELPSGNQFDGLSLVGIEA